MRTVGERQRAVGDPDQVDSRLDPCTPAGRPGIVEFTHRLLEEAAQGAIANPVVQLEAVGEMIEHCADDVWGIGVGHWGSL